jgi:hypothetical protein
MEVGDGMFGHSSPPLDFATMIPLDFLPALGQLFLYITLHDVYIYTTYYSSNCSDVLCLFPLKFRDGTCDFRCRSHRLIYVQLSDTSYMIASDKQSMIAYTILTNMSARVVPMVSLRRL